MPARGYRTCIDKARPLNSPDTRNTTFIISSLWPIGRYAARVGAHMPSNSTHENAATVLRYDGCLCNSARFAMQHLRYSSALSDARAASSLISSVMESPNPVVITSVIGPRRTWEKRVTLEAWKYNPSTGIESVCKSFRSRIRRDHCVHQISRYSPDCLTSFTFSGGKGEPTSAPNPSSTRLFKVHSSRWLINTISTGLENGHRNSALGFRSDRRVRVIGGLPCLRAH